MTPAGTLTPAQREELLAILAERFEQNRHRHEGIEWDDIRGRLEAAPDRLASLHAMEDTGGEPDVVGQHEDTGEYLFYDCALESPKGRRSVCYDPEALASRKKHKPKHSAVGMADEMGVRLLTGEEYARLQALGPVDTKTSSWIATPPEIRELGGALFGDHRYGTVFTYHNGAESYYAARGFRCVCAV